MNIQIRSFPPMPTRPCRYCLSMQDDSVFADFNVDENGCLYILRISYDGYGCCTLDSKIKIGKIDKIKSESVINQIEANNFESLEMIQIIREYFQENKEFLWEDALKDHDLI